MTFQWGLFHHLQLQLGCLSSYLVVSIHPSLTTSFNNFTPIR